MSLQQPDIEAGYFSLPEQEIFLRIEERKKELAGRLLILCHHYQQESLFRFADLKGDSLKLAREAASVHDREFIIFCGVHFMAESADILARPHQKVMLPHLHAGCPMADMATVGAVSMAYRDLVQAGVVQ
ncbi:MAG: quinolinate synthase NadA, partial [Proteobacteria bacterium]|nr:quinolinate synthase NadA [Pseudomonadota bacterium]